MNKQKIKIKSGFTLMEVLIVIAIIGILASIVLQSLTYAKTKAAYASFKASMKSAASAAVVCRDDSGTVTGGAGGTNLCTLGAEYGQWPAVGKCGSFGNFTVNNGDQSDWEFENACDGSCDADDDAAGGEGCNANGCNWGGC